MTLKKLISGVFSKNSITKKTSKKPVKKQTSKSKTTKAKVETKSKKINKNQNIIPTIFALDKNSFSKKLKTLSEFSSIIHLDFMDGVYVKNSSVSLKCIEEILKYKNISFEIHLMAKNPKKYLSKIKNLNIKKVIVHYEVFGSGIDLIETAEKFRKNNIKCFVAIEPQTQFGNIAHIIEYFDGVMIMGVKSGSEGQKFIDSNLVKIKKIKKLYPGVPIQIDGGVTEDNIVNFSKAKVNFLCVGSYISKDLNNSSKNYRKLNKLFTKKKL